MAAGSALSRLQAQAPATPPAAAAAKYDLLLKGGHVIDARNGVDAVRDVAIAGGKIALVAASIPAADAGKTIDVAGLYVTPGLIDIHAHVYTGTGERGSYAGDNSVYPDGFSFRVGVTTVVDAGGSGWRNFEDFKSRVIDRSRTRVLAFLNIVGNGMRGGKFESDQADMEVEAGRRDGPEAQGDDRRHQDRALHRPGVDAGRSRGRGRHRREHPGDGRLRQQPSRHAAARRSVDEEAAARRHLHPHVLRPAQRAGRRQAEPRHDRRAQARRDLRRRPRRRQLQRGASPCR